MECEIYRIFKTCKRPFMGAFSVCMTVPLKKITKICSSLTWCQSKKCKVCVRIPKMNMCLQLPLRSSHARMFPK